MKITEENRKKTCYLNDSSYWYKTDEQAKEFLDFKQTPEYKAWAVDQEFDLFKQNLDILKDKFKEEAYNVVDIGCGDGISTLNIVDLLKENKKVNYIPIDMSSYMIKEATKNAEIQGLEVMKTQPTSFEDKEEIKKIIDQSSYQSSKFFFLGSTFLNYDPKFILPTLKTLMKDGDILCVGITLIDQNVYEKVRPYEEAKGEDEFFSMALKEIGFDRDVVKFYERKYEGKGETCYEFLDKVKVVLKGEIIEFNPGDIFIPAYSYLYTPETIRGTVTEYFPDSDIFINKEKENCVFLSQK